MPLEKFHYIYSIGTDALYTPEEKEVHKKLVKLYKIRKRWNSDTQKWRKACVNRVIKKYKAKLTELLDGSLEQDIHRTVDPNCLKDKFVINLFDSELTRALNMPDYQLSDELIMVNVYFFQVLKSIIFNGFILNGEKYVFYTASAGQIRTKRMIAIKESSYKRIQGRLFCGLTVDKINALGGINSNKFAAYAALTNSATDQWDGFDIRRAIVVDDFETKFPALVDYINYETYEVNRKTMDVDIPCTDGWGIVDGETTRMCRAPWIKGLLTQFPLQQWLREECPHDKRTVKDAWGKEHNLVEENIKVIFCLSQMKLKKFYSSWDEYCDEFEKNGCTVNYCNMEEENIKSSRINYQMLQQLSSITQPEIDRLVRRSNEDIEKIGVDYRTTMRLLGADDWNKDKSSLQEALSIYPELFRDEYSKEILRQTKKSLVKQAKAGKVRVNGKYLFVAPNPLPFLRWLTTGEESPYDELADGDVYTNQFPADSELMLLRSPSLGKEWAIKKNRRNEYLDKWLGQSKCIYTSSYDTVSKMLAFDCDGDKLLVIKDSNLLKVAKRTMDGVVPLYYEMKKAQGGELTPETIYRGMSLAYTSGNIGPISNLITIVHNNDEEDREEADLAIKWLTMETNFRIDGSKTLFFLTRPNFADKIIKKHTKSKLPNFFIYAKDKMYDQKHPEKSQVEPPNQSAMNRIAASIVPSRLKYNKNLGQLDYRMLMNVDAGFMISDNCQAIKSYDYWQMRVGTIEVPENVSADEDLYIYRKIRTQILNECRWDLDFVVNSLVAYLYTVRPNSHKKMLWACFGDVIVKNLKNNTKDLGQICPICGRRFKAKGNNKDKQIVCCAECKNKWDSARRHDRTDE